MIDFADQRHRRGVLGIFVECGARPPGARKGSCRAGKRRRRRSGGFPSARGGRGGGGVEGAADCQASQGGLGAGVCAAGVCAARARASVTRRRARAWSWRPGSDSARSAHSASRAASDRLMTPPRSLRSSATKSAPAPASLPAASIDLGVSDAGSFEDFRPPADPFEEQLERHRRRAAARLAEHHIIGALFAGGHRVVAQCASAPAPTIRSGFRLSSASSSASPAPATWTPSAPEPRREPRVVLQNQRAVRRDRRLEEGRDDRLRLALGAGRKPDERARDRRGGEGLGECPDEASRVRRREARRDEVERAGGRVGRQKRQGFGEEPLCPTNAAKPGSRQASGNAAGRGQICW